MRKILLLLVVGAAAVGAYNYRAGRDIFQLPGTSAAASVNTAVRGTEKVMTKASLTPKIKAKMALDDLVKASDIDVDSYAGVVTLTGDVSSEGERRRALRIAAETAGVTKLVDRLRVR